MKDQIEKQAIEEMAAVIERTEQIARDAHCGLPSPTMYAKDLYWHGYRRIPKPTEAYQGLPKDIKDMAVVIASAIEFDELDFGMAEKTEIIAEKAAEKFYAEGYRKQSEGEWIAKKEMYRTPSANNYYCSNCQKNAIFDSFMGTSRITKYCPNCGAKMKGGAE